MQPSSDILHPLYQVTNRLRWVLLLHALVVNALRLDQVAHPVALCIACAVMTGWTAMVSLWQSRPSMRTPWVMGADVFITALVLASSRWILGRDALMDSYRAVPVYWFAAAPLVVAVWRGMWWGLGSGVLLALVKFVQEPPDDRVWAATVLLGLSIWALAAMVDTLRDSMADRDARNARLAVLAERDRLNRIVHDGALQVLALVEREGPALGPKGEQLARAARQQEALLRRLLQDRSVGQLEAGAATRTDVATMLQAHAGERVTVSVMAGEVPMPTSRAQELDAAVSEALLNVAKHAGPEARAWVLLEEEDGQLTVSIRDNGVGMSREQLDQAIGSGRLGINESILGRIGDIGGVAVARSHPDRGVEWEFRIPLEEVE
ncbi:MacS family sensor histidine kinase [Luteococcus sp. OSA5]|uniref:MacS family sensor histidine kinase n=1 Tax=Luteococcus sp. OSA5 TaxID=3401630 RepID=UPI003B431FE2